MRGPVLLALMFLSGCAPGPSACMGGNRDCAAAQVPSGMRQVLKGHRIVRFHWQQKSNKESGVPDIGIKAEWEPIVERR